MSALWGMYLVFPLVLPLIQKVRSRVAALALAIVLLTVFFVSVSIAPSSAVSLRVTCEFFAGCLLYRFFAMTPRWRWAGLTTAVGCIAILLSLLLKVAGRFPAGVWPLSVSGVIMYWAVPLFALVLLGTAYAQGPVSRALSTRPALAVGRASYSLFATHGSVMLALFLLLPPTFYVASSVAIRLGVLTVWVVAVAMVACPTHRFVEVPGRTALLKRGRRSQAPIPDRFTQTDG